MKLFAVWTMVGLFLSVGATISAGEELAPGYDECAEKAQSTAEQMDCLSNAYKYWDKILNDNFKVAKEACTEAEHPKECASQLLKAQRLWIQYKEAMAPVIVELNGGGSLSRLLGDSFMVRETKRQAKLLSGQEE